MLYRRLRAMPRLARNTLSCLTGGRPSRLPAALLTVWRARTEVGFYLRTGDQAAAARLRRRFGLVPDTDRSCGMPETLFSESGADWSPVRATVIIPVYNAVEHVARLLDRLPETLDPDQPVVVVDDGSDAPEIAPLLAAFASRHTPTRVLRHSSNEGFVTAVATGTAAADAESHIVLLNTDTLPPPGWVRRLVAPIIADPGIASVTPFSNAAEILSIPVPGHVTNLAPTVADAIDQTAAGLEPREIELPTGIGFCMAMNRWFLNRIGGFDPAFGRGYGEEVDWCCRARAAGGRHVVQTRLFVGHRGGASFGQDAKTERIRKASRIIDERYPDYSARVRDWIDAQPVEPERIALSIAWLAAVSYAPVPLFLGHMQGGGAETALRREIVSRLATGVPGLVVLRVGGPRAWRIELHGTGFRISGDTDKEELVLELLAPLRRRAVVYSCGVGAADPAAVPRVLSELARNESDRLTLRMHDHFPISPSWTLLDSRGRYTGIPDETDPDPAHRVSALGRPQLSLADWRALWRPVLARADEVTVFSKSGSALLARAYPEVSPKTVVRPHALPALPGPIPPGGAAIGVLGGINRAKGAEVLNRLARATARRIVVIGEMERRYHLPAPHIVHGRYEQAAIRDVALRHDIGLWFVPSICPETFSFATHEALSTGLPVAGFGIGAQADALEAAPNGHVLLLPSEADAAAISDALEAIASQAASADALPTISRRAS